jgi:hypothetical protein
MYILISIAGGALFGVMDGLLNANPIVVKLYKPYEPIARKSINMLAGIVIDLVYGFILAAIFILLYESLPGGTGVLKGISFGILAWFLRVIMYAASNWMMFKVPLRTILYTLIAGLVEMLLLGLLYGIGLRL